MTYDSTGNWLIQLYKTLPNLTLNNQFSVPFADSEGGTHPFPAGAHLTQAPHPEILIKIK